MKVKFLMSIASADFSFHPGQLTKIDDELAAKWQRTGICEIVAEPEEVKEAVATKKTTKK